MTMAPRIPAAPVADLDRSRLRAELADHYVAGRLSESQLVERLQAAASARTTADVEQLTFDLQPVWTNPPAPTVTPSRAAGRGALGIAVDVILGVLGICALPCLFLLFVVAGRTSFGFAFLAALGAAAVTAASVHFAHRFVARGRP